MLTASGRLPAWRRGFAGRDETNGALRMERLIREARHATMRGSVTQCGERAAPGGDRASMGAGREGEITWQHKSRPAIFTISG